MDLKSFFFFAAFVMFASLFTEGNARKLNIFGKIKRSAQADDEAAAAATVDWCTSPFKNFQQFAPRYLDIYCPPAEAEE